MTPTLGLALLLVASVEAPAVVIDGRFDDWKGVRVALKDPADAPGADIDFRQLRITHDTSSLYFGLELGREANLHALHGALALLLDSDGDPHTGRTEEGVSGIDLVVELSPLDPSGRPTPGARLRVPSGPAAWTAHPIADAALMFAPSFASRRIEIALARGAKVGDLPPLFLGPQVRGVLTYRHEGGEQLDRTSVFVHRLDAGRGRPQVVRAELDPLARNPATRLRVLSWNVSRSSFMKNPEAFGRIVRALAPDVLILDELPPDSGADHLTAFLTGALPPQPDPFAPPDDTCAVERPACGLPWNAVFGACGGRQRVGVAARAPLTPIGSLAWVDYPEPPLRALAAPGDAEAERRVDELLAQGVGTGGARLTIDGHALLAASVDLQCCGRAAGPEDRLRVIESSAISHAVRAAVGAEQPKAVILAGDFNLVGSRVPLDLVSRNLDPDGDHLEIVEALQLDGRSNTTWEDPGQPFAPGRLDFMLYSESSLELVRAFVFDSRDLSDHWRARHGVQEGDSLTASDHLPIVADFRWK